MTKALAKPIQIQTHQFPIAYRLLIIILIAPTLRLIVKVGFVVAIVDSPSRQSLKILELRNIRAEISFQIHGEQK